MFNFEFFECTGNETEFERLLRSGADFNALDEEGNSALLLSAEKGVNLIENFKVNTKANWYFKYRFRSYGETANRKWNKCQCNKQIQQFSIDHR